MSQGDDKSVRCSDGCGAVVPSVTHAEVQGWTFLVISKRYRCEACRLALDRVNQRVRDAATV